MEQPRRAGRRPTRGRARAVAGRPILRPLAASSILRAAACVACLLGVVASETVAQQSVCGDANRDGVVDDVDGARLLRAAALLSFCDLSVCDVDGDGVVTDVDAVRVLRKAALIPVEEACGGVLRPIPSPGTTPVASCGDRVCSAGETCATCARDCGACASPTPFCGDGTCQFGEHCGTCPEDCGDCAGGHVCCRHCGSGKPCGHQCIAKTRECHQPPGCACY